MTDMFSPEKRSEIMSRIRSKNTEAEVIVFRYLQSRKIYFQKHYGNAVGKPDLALPRKKFAVFIDGDFWHGRTLDRVVERKGQNNLYWTEKIKRNVERDKQINRQLSDERWKILRVWETDIKRKKSRMQFLDKIERFITAQ